MIWYDGTVRQYDGNSGELISETVGERPDRTLYEVLETPKYRVESELHQPPRIYSKETGELLTVLESKEYSTGAGMADTYLTYVTEVGDQLITEYVTSDGERYGLLWNSSFELLAKLPNLCDVYDGSLIFDYGTGSLRRSKIYDLQELSEIANDF